VDLLPIGVFILIVLASGGIAVFADWLGRKLGKKRLTVFRLRPKTTAQLGTFMSGIIISGVTILVLAAVSSDVRQWIVEGRRALAQRDQLVKEIAGVQAELKSGEQKRDVQVAQIKGLEGDIKSKATQVSQQKSLLGKQRELLAKQQDNLVGLQARIDSLTPKVTRLEETLRLANDRIRRVNAERERVQAALTQRQTQLRLAQSRLQTVRTSLARIQKDLVAAKGLRDVAINEKNDIARQNLELLNENNKLLDTKKDLDLQVGNLQKARDEAQRQYALAQAAFLQAESDLATATTQLDDARTALKQARTEGELLMGITRATREQPMTYRMGEEVTRISVGAGLSVKAAESNLTNLLRSARMTASKRGAKPNETLGVPAAAIIEHPPKTPEQIERDIVRQIAGSQEPVVVVAYSSVNSFVGEPVSLEVSVFPNPLVYKRGQIVAESRIDGKKDEGVIFRQLSDFIGTKIRERAKQDRMIARTGSDSAYGEISSDTILKLVSDVRAASRQVRLVALADEDTRAGDELKLNFAIR